MNKSDRKQTKATAAFRLNIGFTAMAVGIIVIGVLSIVGIRPLSSDVLAYTEEIFPPVEHISVIEGDAERARPVILKAAFPNASSSRICEYRI